MNVEQSNKRKKSFNNVRGMMGISMGIVYLIVAVMVVYLERTGYISIGTTFSYIVGVLMAAYGIFRMYRGWMQMQGKVS
jgi:uncharacterized membrane protein YidH (DUF202 family)